MAFVSIVGTSLLTTGVASWLGLDPAAINLLGLARWPIAFVFLAIAVGVLYKLAPNFDASWRWSLAGGAIFAVGWLVATAIFGFYVANFGHYSNTYGAIGGVIVLMLWFYISALILIGTAELIASTLKELEPATVEAGRRSAAAAAEGTDASPSGRAANPLSGRVANPLSGRVAKPPTGAVGIPPRSMTLMSIDPEHGRPAGSSPAGSSPADPRTAPSGPLDWATAGAAVAIGAAIGTLAAHLLKRERD